jgi:hypothetical protein
MKKKKKSVVGGIAVILALVLVLCACEEEEEIEYGLLTIKNAPALGTYNSYGGQQRNEEWGGGVYFDEEITTQADLDNWTQYNRVAYYDNDVPPFKLADSKEVLKGFLKSGTYLVYLYRATGVRGNTYFLSGVTFKDGNATIDFNDMTLESSLPRY